MTVKITVNGKEFDSINEAVEYAKQVENESGVWKPKKGDRYWVISSNAGVVSCPWCDNHDDRSFFETGNVFKTKDAAEKEVKRRKVYQRLKELAGGYEHRMGYNNHYIYWSGDFEGFRVWSDNSNIQVNQVYFLSSGQAQAAIDELGDDLMVLFE